MIMISCNNCDSDLSTTKNCVAYRLVLANQKIPIYSINNAVTSMGVFPPIDEGEVHFCCIGCLKSWLKKRYP